MIMSTREQQQVEKQLHSSQDPGYHSDSSMQDNILSWPAHEFVEKQLWKTNKKVQIQA